MTTHRSVKRQSVAKGPKPKLVRIGKHFLNPADVAGIKRAKEGLYVIMLRSEPSPAYPLWLDEEDLEDALQHFDVLGDDL